MKPGLWTAQRVAELSTQEIKQLRANAVRLKEPEVAALCDQALKAARRAQTDAARKALPRRAS